MQRKVRVMDSISNLSLVEIAAADDSLLLTATAKDDSSTLSSGANFFSCSPLLSLRSLPSQPQSEGRVGVVDSEYQISSPKDSANKENLNWSTPKLSVESHQMKKRKKKGGGYNLRKSLAWDRAFFTEEGVLNPLELSMISGTSTPNRTNTELNIVQEEEEPTSASLALKEIEENLFKQPSNSVSVQDTGTGVGLSSKPAAFTKDTLGPPSVAKRKVLAVNDVFGNRPKRNACPRPVPSSSLKRPDTAKAPSKESEVGKIPGPKSNVSVITPNARCGTLGSSSSKRNQYANPASNVLKCAGVKKGLSKIPRIVPINMPSDPKVDLGDKCSVTRNLTKQAGKQLDSSVSESHLPSRLHQPGTGANKVSEACLSQCVSDTDKKKQQTQFQTTKPSSLRMPSPSLGFFSQSKPFSSNSQLQKSFKLCRPAESNIPKSSKLETNSVTEARLANARRKRSEIVEGAAKNHTKKSSLSDVNSKPSTQEDKRQMAGVEVECDSLGFEIINKQEIGNTPEHVDMKHKEQAKPHKSDNVSNMEDEQFPTHEKKLLSKSTHEQLEKEDDQSIEDKLYVVLSNGVQSVFQEPQSISMQRTLIGKDNISNTMHTAMEQDENEKTKLVACDVPTSNECLLLQGKHGTSPKDGRHLGDSKEYNCVKTVLAGSIQGTPCKNTEQESDGTGDFAKHGGEAQVYLLNGNPTVNCNDAAGSIFEPINQQLQGEQFKTPNQSIVGETGSKNVDESRVDSCQLVHQTMLPSKGFPEKAIAQIDRASESEPNIAKTESYQHPTDGQSGFIQREPVHEGCGQVIDPEATHQRTKLFESDRMYEDCITVPASACSREVNNIYSESRPFLVNDIENLNFTPQLCPMGIADCHSRGNDISINNYCTISELQLRDDSFLKDTSMHCRIQHGVSGKFDQQTSTLTCSGINEKLCEESLGANPGHLLGESETSEVSADLISNTKGSICYRAESPSGITQHTLLAQSVRELDHANKSEESHIDEQAQSFDENPVVYNCNNEQCLSVTNDQCSMVDGNNINEESHLSEFQGPTFVIDSQHVNNILQFDGDWVPTNTACSEEMKKFFLSEDELEGCNIDTSKNNDFNHHTQAMLENKDGNLDVDESAEHLQMGDAKKGSTDVLPVVEVPLNHKVISAEFDSSVKVSEDHVTEGSEVGLLSSKILSEEAETCIFEREEFPNTDMQHLRKGWIHFAEASSEVIQLKKSAIKSKQEVPTVKPPPNAVPFSDEWLTAIEAAGEEILTMKGGAVQNSPPDKPQQEPGPWSPVRRKNQAIGPFDCTKHTNIPHPSS